MSELSDARLAAVLASVGDHLVVPAAAAAAAADADAAPSADPGRNGSALRAVPAEPAEDRPPSEVEAHPRGGLVGARRTQQRWRRVLVAAAIAIAVALTALVAAPAGEAVADWFGLRATGIELVDQGEGDPDGLPYLAEGLDPVDRTTAEARLGAPLPELDLGPAEVLAPPPEGGVLMAWDDDATTLWVRRAGDQWFGKLLTVEDTGTELDGLGDAAISIEGRHVLETPLRRLAADNVVIWIDGDFELRLESDAPIDDLVAIAHTVTLSPP
jgi:hypothetical protein